MCWSSRLEVHSNTLNACLLAFFISSHTVFFLPVKFVQIYVYLYIYLYIQCSLSEIRKTTDTHSPHPSPRCARTENGTRMRRRRRRRRWKNEQAVLFFLSPVTLPIIDAVPVAVAIATVNVTLYSSPCMSSSFSHFELELAGTTAHTAYKISVTLLPFKSIPWMPYYFLIRFFWSSSKKIQLQGDRSDEARQSGPGVDVTMSHCGCTNHQNVPWHEQGKWKEKGKQASLALECEVNKSGHTDSMLRKWEKIHRLLIRSTTWILNG